MIKNRLRKETHILENQFGFYARKCYEFVRLFLKVLISFLRSPQVRFFLEKQRIILEDVFFRKSRSLIVLCVAVIAILSTTWKMEL